MTQLIIINHHYNKNDHGILINPDQYNNQENQVVYFSKLSSSFVYLPTKVPGPQA